jgi:hypothetical protein
MLVPNAYMLAIAAAFVYLCCCSELSRKTAERLVLRYPHPNLLCLRVEVLTVLQMWIQSYWHDFAIDDELKTSLQVLLLP